MFSLFSLFYKSLRVSDWVEDEEVEAESIEEEFDNSIF